MSLRDPNKPAGVFRGGDPRLAGKKGGENKKGKRHKRPPGLEDDPRIQALTPRKRKYWLARAAGLAKTEAARSAGYSESAAKSAVRAIETPNAAEAFREHLQKMIPMQKVSKVLVEGLEATDTQFFSKDGVVTDSRDRVDFQERRLAADMTAKMAGYYEPHSSVEVTKSFSEDSIRRLADLADMLGLKALDVETKTELQKSHVPLVIDAEVVEPREGQNENCEPERPE